MKMIFLWLALFWSLATVHGQASNEDGKLELTFKNYLNGYFQLRPMEATRLGEHRFDAELDDLSTEARTTWIKYIKQALAELPNQISREKLSADGRVDLDIFRHSLETEIWVAENTRPFEEDPRIYNGYINDCTYLILSQSTLPLETNVTHCIARMALIPKVMAAARQNLRNPPRVHTETAIRQNRGAINFYDEGIFEFAQGTKQKAALKAAAQSVVAELKKYQDFLEKELLPTANGHWRIGSEKFS